MFYRARNIWHKSDAIHKPLHQELGVVHAGPLAWPNWDNVISYTCGFPGMTNQNESHYILLPQVDDCLNYYLTMNVSVKQSNVWTCKYIWNFPLPHLTFPPRLKVIIGQDKLIPHLTNVTSSWSQVNSWTSWRHTYIYLMWDDTCMTFDIMQIKALSLKPSFT